MPYVPWLARWIKWRACDVGEAITITMSSAHSPTFPSLHLRHNWFSNPSVAFPTSQFILQPFRCFTYVTVHSPTLLSLLLDHKLFIELILQPFRHFTYVTIHSPTLPSLYLRHRSFSNSSFASPTSQALHRADSPTFPSLYLRHSSFSNPSVASPTSQIILQPFRCFTYIKAHSPILLSLLLRHFTYVQLFSKLFRRFT